MVRLLITVLLSCCIFLQVHNNVLHTLPHCQENSGSGSLIVSTLDGKVSALNSNGSLGWQIDTGPGSLLVSNIHKLELTNNGEWVRIIPSLTGTLYKFDGRTVDPIPISAEELLKSSFRYSDDLVIAGGIEVRTYGVGFKTGTLYYECTSQKCSNKVDQNVDNLLLIERSTHIIRAVEPRTGNERWNFSVGLHNAKLHGISCVDANVKLYEWNLTAVVPEGELRASITLNGVEIQNWKYNFPSPIVRVWRWTGKTLSEVNLFTPKNAPLVVKTDPVLPSIYIGMHNRQLYIHESAEMQRLLLKKPSTDVVVVESNSIAKIPWKPIPASTKPTEDDSTALSVLNESEYVNGHGFYLYTEEDLKKKEGPLCKKNNSFVSKLLPKKIKVDVIQSYLSMVNDAIVPWWQEICCIIVTFILCHIVFRYTYAYNHPPMRQDKLNDVTVEKRDSTRDTTSREASEARLLLDRRISENNDNNYISRYESDFDTLARLGKGGYGVVFRVRMKTDKCEYAVKRINLPNEAEKKERDRVMREVIVLAQLSHPNIIRYFNSWIEYPPVGWKEEHDRKWIPDKSFVDDSETTSTHVRRPMRRPIIPLSSEDDSFIVFAGESNQGDVNSNTSESKISTPNTQRKTNGCDRPSNKHNAADTHEAYLYIQMQLCEKESLKEWLEQHHEGDRPFEKVLDIFKQILSAVQYIHSKGLIHRDLKPSNILFSLDGQVKVGDFGLVKDMQEAVDSEATHKGLPASTHHTRDVGTMLYMSPEQCQCANYNYKVDIYSLGLIFFELLYPFSTGMERAKTLEDVKKNRYPPDFIAKYPEPYRLLQKMLCHNPNDRLTTTDIQSRPPFNQKDPKNSDK